MSQITTASGRFLIRMEPGLHAALRAAARSAGMSLNEYCVSRLSQRGTGIGPAEAAVVARAAATAGRALVGVAAFGSWTRGEATAESDVDVLIVVDDGLPITRALYTSWDAEPLRWDGRPVEPHFARMPEAGAPISGLWAEVAIDGVVLFERGLELSRQLTGVRAAIAAGELVRRWTNGSSYWVRGPRSGTGRGPGPKPSRH